MEKQSIIKEVKALAVKLGKTPTLKQNRLKLGISKYQFYKHWGNYTSFCYDVGLTPNKHYMDKDQLLNGLKILKKELDKVPKKDDILTCDYLPSAETYNNYFGGVRKALYKAGLISKDKIPNSRGKPKNMSDEEMLLGLIKLARELKKVPVTREINNCSYLPSAGCYQRRFNSLTNVLKMTGIYYNKIKGEFLKEGKSPYIF